MTDESAQSIHNRSLNGINAEYMIRDGLTPQQKWVIAQKSTDDLYKKLGRDFRAGEVKLIMGQWSQFASIYFSAIEKLGVVAEREQGAREDVVYYRGTTTEAGVLTKQLFEDKWVIII